MGSADDSEGFAHLIALISDRFGDRQVDQFQIPPTIDHKIFRFDIPADNKILVKVL